MRTTSMSETLLQDYDRFKSHSQSYSDFATQVFREWYRMKKELTDLKETVKTEEAYSAFLKKQLDKLEVIEKIE